MWCEMLKWKHGLNVAPHPWVMQESFSITVTKALGWQRCARPNKVRHLGGWDHHHHQQQQQQQQYKEQQQQQKHWQQQQQQQHSAIYNNDDDSGKDRQNDCHMQGMYVTSLPCRIGWASRLFLRAAFAIRWLWPFDSRCDPHVLLIILYRGEWWLPFIPAWKVT